MSFGDKAEQRTNKQLCVGLGHSLMETKQLLERHIVVKQCFQILSLSMAQTIFRTFLGPLSLKMTGKHTVITESLTLNVLNSLQDVACQTVRIIALRNSIAVTSAHMKFTEHMYMISAFSVI